MIFLHVFHQKTGKFKGFTGGVAWHNPPLALAR